MISWPMLSLRAISESIALQKWNPVSTKGQVDDLVLDSHLGPCLRAVKSWPNLCILG